METNTRSARLGIGGLSQVTGCNIETIRYYERIGLLPHAARSAGGHRQYAEAQVRRLGFIRRSRELGFTLDQVRTLLTLVDGGRYTCAQVKRITMHHLAEVHGKVADLQKIERVLREMAAQCDGGTVPTCPVIDALFDPGADTASASIRTSLGRADVSPRTTRSRRRAGTGAVPSDRGRSRPAAPPNLLGRSSALEPYRRPDQHPPGRAWGFSFEDPDATCWKS